MARHTFLGDMASWVMDTGSPATSTDGLAGDVVLVIPGQDVLLYDAKTGGNQYTDLLDEVGSPITSVIAGADGSLPPISGPDTDPEVTVMWADASGGAGPRRLVVATDLGPALATVVATQAAHDAELVALNASAPAFVYYNAATASYPVRPSTGGPVWWVGPVAPAFGGLYAVDGLDYWIGPVT